MVYTVTLNPSIDYIVAVDELSVSPGKILSLRKRIREINPGN